MGGGSNEAPPDTLPKVETPGRAEAREKWLAERKYAAKMAEWAEQSRQIGTLGTRPAPAHERNQTPSAERHRTANDWLDNAALGLGGFMNPLRDDPYSPTKSCPWTGSWFSRRL